MTGYPDLDGTQPCAHADPEWFFPPTQAASAETLKKVRPLCTGCAFSQPCLDYAMTHPVQGIWGGRTESERAQARRDQHLALPRPVDDRPMWKQALDMKAEGLDVAEIADLLATSYQSVWSMLSRHRGEQTA